MWCNRILTDDDPLDESTASQHGESPGTQSITVELINTSYHNKRHNLNIDDCQ